MRRQLLLMVLATTSLVLVALLVPMGVLVQRFVEEDALASVGLELQQVEAMLASVPDREAVAEQLGTLNSEQDDVRATVFFVDGQVIGPDPVLDTQVADVLATGQTEIRETAGGVEVIGAAFGRRDDAVIRLVVQEERFSRGVLTSWLVLAGLGLTLLLLSLLVADRLGQFFVAPLGALGSTASRLGAGELEARVEPAGPPDVRHLGETFNQLAARIGELVALQREDAADLAHRLRTPLTSLRLDVESVPDPATRDRLTAQVDTLAAMVSAIIDEARRPVREGVAARCDAGRVVADRTSFWAVLAEDQGRTMWVEVPDDPLPVRVGAEDLGAALDALLGNVFQHTTEGAGILVTVQPRSAGGAQVTVADRGQGLPDGEVLARGQSRGGSTGLGLDIVRRTCEASGGRLELESLPGVGTTCRLVLGPPAGYPSSEVAGRNHPIADR